MAMIKESCTIDSCEIQGFKLIVPAYIAFGPGVNATRENIPQAYTIIGKRHIIRFTGPLNLGTDTAEYMQDGTQTHLTGGNYYFLHITGVKY